RTLLPADDAAGGRPVAVVSYSFWQHKLGGDPNAIGRPLAMNGVSVQVVGVAPPEFFGLQPGEAPELWIPLTLYCEQMVRTSQYELREPKTWWMAIGGRLKPGVTTAQAQAEAGVLFRQSLGDTSKLADDDIPQIDAAPVANVLNRLRRQFSQALLLLMAMVGVV